MHLCFTAVSQARLTQAAAGCNTHTVVVITHLAVQFVQTEPTDMFWSSRIMLIAKTQMIKLPCNNCQRRSGIIDYEQ